MNRAARRSPPKPQSRRHEPLADDLVARAQAGDRGAFERLVQLHEGEVLEVARRFVPEDDARDVAQRTFVRAFVNLHAFRGESALGTWLRRIARNLALNHVRDHGRLEPLERFEHLAERVTSGTYAVDRHMRERLREAVGRLPPKQRLVVELRLFRDRSFREIAEIADCTEDSAKANYHHATKRLREWLA